MIHVLKANGEREPFSEKKVLHSIHRAGIPEALTAQVIDHINSTLYDNIPSSEIYHHIMEFLSTSPQPFITSRYSLKQAIMDLGPTGYPFEDYIAKILQTQGYTTQTRQILQGSCVTHEIDVIAQKNTVIPTKIMIEAKFHNTVGMRTNVHVPLYTKSRFEDIKTKHMFTQVWLITNTKATVDAIAYAGCVGMKVMTWSYPEGESLRELVEKFQLFPITTLTTLPEPAKQQLLAKGTVICKDICTNTSLLDTLDLSREQKEKIIAESQFICSYS
jgi:Holliday junction resolvase-like predicted endonuclease